ncbi:MAG TPA: HAMP domain-containing sensor histidine kinase [bacterium]
MLSLLAILFLGFLGWFVAGRFGPVPGDPHRGPFGPPFGFLLVLLLIAGLLAAARSLRGLTVPVAGVMEASGRLAQGDYTTRVREWGPPEVRSLARAFNEMAERLQAHEQQRRNLLADVTHELRTPLAVIQGNLEGLLDGVYPRDDAHLTPILEEAQILATLIEDLRTLALAETGTLELHPEPTDLGALIEETLAAHRGRADASGVMLDTQIAADLPALDVDPTRIHQVLTNVLSNALRHTGRSGRISVVVGRQPAAGAEERITVSVTDTGTGISAEDLPHVFDRFYRSPDSPGSGLGLAIAKNLVILHGGEIGAESAPGVGTTVKITLPGSRRGRLLEDPDHRPGRSSAQHER